MGLPTQAESDEGENAVITAAKDAEEIHVLRWIDYSYDATPTTGKLTVTIADSDVLEVDIKDEGRGRLDFPNGLYGKFNEALVITLLGVDGKQGRLSVLID